MAVGLLDGRVQFYSARKGTKVRTHALDVAGAAPVHQQFFLPRPAGLPQSPLHSLSHPAYSPLPQSSPRLLSITPFTLTLPVPPRLLSVTSILTPPTFHYLNHPCTPCPTPPTLHYLNPHPAYFPLPQSPLHSLSHPAYSPLPQPSPRLHAITSITLTLPVPPRLLSLGDQVRVRRLNASAAANANGYFS